MCNHHTLPASVYLLRHEMAISFSAAWDVIREDGINHRFRLHTGPGCFSFNVFVRFFFFNEMVFIQICFSVADSSQEYTDSTGIDVHEFLVNTLKNNPRYDHC